MADFNIGILSTLDVDTGSSKKKVNETIKEIEKSINSIQAELEVKDSNSSQSSAKKSANAVIDNINKSGGLKRINVEFDINQTNSKKNIQKALASISNEFSNKKIQVGIQATTDAKSLNQARNTEKNSAPLTLDESTLSFVELLSSCLVSTAPVLSPASVETAVELFLITVDSELALLSVLTVLSLSTVESLTVSLTLSALTSPAPIPNVATAMAAKSQCLPALYIL